MHGQEFIRRLLKRLRVFITPIPDDHRASSLGEHNSDAVDFTGLLKCVLTADALHPNTAVTVAVRRGLDVCVNATPAVALRSCTMTRFFGSPTHLLLFL